MQKTSLLGKLKLFFIAMLLIILVNCVGILAFAKAEPVFDGVSSLEAFEVNGANVIVEGDDGINGLNFTMSMSDDEYKLMSSSVGTDKAYKSLETGLVIAPKYYNEQVEICYDSLFGANPTYDFATYKEDGYVYEGDKIRVVNINANSWVNRGDVYTYSGAIVDILQDNETELFTAVGYVKLTDNAGVETYKFTSPLDANVISVALSDIKNGKLDETQEEWVRTNWVEDRLNAVEEELTIVNVDNLTDKNYSLFDLITDEQSKKYIDGFADKTAVDVVLTDVNANTKTLDFDSAKNFDLSIEANLRIWTAQVVCGDDVIWTGSVDFYSLDAEFIWNNEITPSSFKEYHFPKKDGSKVRTEIKTRGVAVEINGGAGVSYKSSGQNGSWFVWEPMHSAEYYQNFTGKNLALSITLSADSSSATGEGVPLFNQGYVCNHSTNYMAEPTKDRSITNTVSIDTIVEKWTDIVKARWDLGGATWDTRHKYGMVYVYNVKNGGKFIISGLHVQITTAQIYGGETLVDLDKQADVTSVNLLDCIKDADAKKINDYLHFGLTAELKGLRNGDYLTVEDITKVDVSTLTDGAYELNVKSYGVPLYTGVLDFYYASKSAVWTDAITSYSVQAGRAETADLGWSNKDITSLSLGDGYEIIDASTVTDASSPLYGKQGKFVKLTSKASAEQMTFSILPLHSKSYYKKFFADKDNVLSFDIYVTGSFKGMSTIGAYYNKDNRFRDYSTWRGTSPTANKWNTYSIPFDSYLLSTEDNLSFSGAYFDFNTLGTKVNSTETMFQFEALSIGSEVYVGLPYIDTLPEYIHSSSTERTASMLGADNYDLTKLFTQQELNKYNYYVTKYGYDKIFYKLTFADQSTAYIWASEDGSINLDLSQVIGTTSAGASLTIGDKILLGAFTIDGKICDIYNFPGHTNVGVFGQVSGANNNQPIVKMGAITMTDLPSPVEVYEISVADSTVKVLQDDFSSSLISSSYSEGRIQTLYNNSVQDSSKSLNINAFQNDIEGAQIQIVSKVDLAEYKLVLADLKCGDIVLEKENFSIYHLLYTNVVRISAGASNPTGTGMYPDAILPMDVAIKNEVNSLKAGINQGIWVSLDVPVSQPAGVYTGTFRLYLSLSVYDIPVTVTVYDHAVSEETRMTIAIGLGYTNIKNLELPYEYDEEGKLIVNSSGNKNGTLPQEIIDAYVKYWTDHRLSTSPVVPSSNFSGSWQGYPYDPDVLFSFDRITVNKKNYYAYEWPLRSKDANGNTVLNAHVDNRTGYTTHGYPLYLDRVDAYFNGMVELAQNNGVTSYTIPVEQAPASNFNLDNINALYNGKWAGKMYEIREDMPDGDKAHVINQLVLRDVMEMFFKKTIELYKSGVEVDVFKKARLYPTWIDEFGISESKTHNAQYLLKYMKDFFPNLSTWLSKVYASDVRGNEFLLDVLDSISKIKIGVTTNTIEDISPYEHYANLIPVIGYYNSEAGRAEIDAWQEIAYGGNAQKWVYTAGNAYPQSSNNIENTVLASRMLGWMMSEYDIEGWLYWASMNSKYMDGIVSSAIKPVVGQTVKDGDIIELDDFYNNAIHYGGVAGDGFLIYPGAYYGVTGPVGTIRLETLTDAIEDYNLFYDLKEMYKEAGHEESFYNVMRRLAEMLYTGVNCKVPAGYTSDFMMSRDTLANMLVMAKEDKVYVDNVYGENGKWYFSVVAPYDVADAVKSSIDATFVSSTDTTVNGISGKKLVFYFPANAKETGYITFSYNGKTINLSVETMLGKAEVEALKWADVDEESVVTYHSSYYSNGAGKTSVDVELVTLSEENAIGGRTSGNYFHVSPVNNSTANVGIAVLPEYITREEVKEYIGKAQLKFDIYMDARNIADGSVRDTWKVWYRLGKSTNSQSECHRWFTVTIDFQEIYDNWDTLMNTNATSYTGTNDDWSTSRRSLFSVNGASHSASGVHTTSFYMGNFRIAHN